MSLLDPRINAYRGDIAAIELRDELSELLSKPAFVAGQFLTLKKGVAGLRKKANPRSKQVSEIRYGDAFVSYEKKDGWHWGQSKRDGYVGYVPDDGFIERAIMPTHRVKQLTTLLFPEPSIKEPPLGVLTLFSAVEVTKMDKDFCQISTGEFIHAHHLTPVADWRERDIVFTAGRMLGVPYLWGGNTPLGFDCSGLVQLACEAAGIACQRDSDMQEATLGAKIADNIEGMKLQRGDVVFFPGHVGIMTDQHALLHANAYHGCVVVEPLKDVILRGSNVTAVRRLG